MRKSVIINVSSQYLNLLLYLIVNAVLARIIAPEEYGIMAIITVFITFFSTLSDLGLGTGIIQNKNLTNEDTNNIFSFSVYVSLFLSCLFWFLSYGIAAFYSDVTLQIAGKWLCISVFFNSLCMVPNGILNREKRFVDTAVRNVVVYVFAAIVAICAAYNGFGVYALVLQSIVSSLLNFIWNWILTKPLFIPAFSWTSIKKIAAYSGFQYAFGVLNFFSRNLDNLLLGRYMGAKELAFYNRAYSFMLYPVNYITGVITPVLHPILSDYQNDIEYIYEQYIKLLKMLAIVSVFVETCCYYLAPYFITLFLGEKWIGAIECFKILSFAIATQMITGTTGSVFQSIGETRLLFIAGSINIAITVASTIFGVLHGTSIEFLAICVATSYIFHFFISFYIMLQFGFKKSYFSFLFEFKKEFFILCIMMLLGRWCPFVCETNIGNLIVGALYFGGIFVLCCIVFKEYEYLRLFFRKGNKKVINDENK